MPTLSTFHRLLACGALLCGLWHAGARAAAAQPVTASALYTLAPVAEPSTAAAGVAAAARRRIRLGLSGGTLADSPRLRVPLPDGRILTVNRTSRHGLDDNGHYWRGDAANGARARVRLVTREALVVGTVESDGRTYALGLDATGTQVLEDVTVTGLRCAGPLVAATTSGGAAAVPRAAAVQAEAVDAALDLLVVYTSETKAAGGGAAALRATAELSVEASNEAFANSRVAMRLRLVDVRETPYVESLSLSTDLDRLTDRTDGLLDDVHAWRDAAGADLVSLIVERNTAQLEGVAWLMQQPSVDFAPLAFSVAMRRTAADLTLAHEIGHNLGLAHDRDNASVAGAYPYAYGYRDPPYFRDVMSYPCLGTPCPLVPYFSTPDVLYGGRPLGRADLEDNARALRLTMPVAAAFRAGAPPAITMVTPSSVSTLGGAQIAIQGTRLATVARIFVDGVLATDVRLQDAGTLLFTAPRHPAGAVTVVLEDDAGQQSSRPEAFSYAATSADADGDALDDDWERAMGLDPASASGAGGATGDPDGDGLTNLRERIAHGHPRGQYRRYFAEGANSAFFSTQLAILNPGASSTGVVARFLAADGRTLGLWRELPARTRRTLTPADIGTLAVGEFSIVVESASPIVVDRTMTWTSVPYGAHAESSLAAPALRWFLAEGATTGTFNLFYLLQNPNPQPAQVVIRYLRAAGPPIERPYTLPPTSRTNIWVNREDVPGQGLALRDVEVSADIEVLNGQPIVVERAMYRDVDGQPFGAGHVSAGTTAPGTLWFLAEGATGAWFDLFVLVANPSASAATAEVTYLLPDGSAIVRTHVVPPVSRYTIWVDQEDGRLADTAVSTSVRILNDVPVVVERSMWWPYSSATWHEAHNAVASRITAARWALAEGEVGGAPSRDTYVLIANTSPVAGPVDVTLLFEDGTATARTFMVLARSRFNVDVRREFPLSAGRRFGLLVESSGGTPVQLVVERAMYWDASNQRWAAGTSAVATPLP